LLACSLMSVKEVGADIVDEGTVTT